MPQEPDSPKLSSDAGSPKAPETTIPSVSPPSPTYEKALTPDEERDRRSVEELVLSARKTGWAECINEVTKLLVKVARMDDHRLIFKRLVTGLDAVAKQGNTLSNDDHKAGFTNDPKVLLRMRVPGGTVEIG